MPEAEFWGQFKTIAEDPTRCAAEVDMYSAEVVEDYDILFPVNDIEQYLSLARRCPGPILELGAGTGRVLCELVAQGHTVVGLDLSQAALEIARRRLAAQPEDRRALARLVEGDATTFAFDQTFGLITIPACSIVLFRDRDARLSMFRRIAEHLKPDGIFAFDYPLLDWARRTEWDSKVVDLRFVRDGAARQIRLGVRAAASGRHLDVNIHWLPAAGAKDGRDLLERKTVLVIDAAEIERELAEAGLAVLARRTQTMPDGGGRLRWLECGRATRASYPLWHPHAPLAATESGVLTLSRGTGATVEDSAGKRYVDLASGLWSTALGQGHEGVIEAVTEQLRTLSYGTLFAGYSNGPARDLSRRLLELAPANLGWCYLTNSGSESVELAIKIARRFHAASGVPRPGIAYVDQSYHGTFFGSMALSGLHPGQEGSAPGLPDAFAVPAPVPRLCPAGLSLEAFEHRCADALEARLRAPDSRIGAFILEPVLGSAGAVVPSPDYLARVARICRETEVLLIADEVATGFGRCGGWFACDRLGLQPDILLLSKGISAGYLPLGAALFSHEIGARLRAAGQSLGHGSSHNGNPACCAAGLATIDALENGALAHGACVSAALSERLRAVAARPPVRRLHGLGLFFGLELEQADGRDLSDAQVATLQELLRGLGVLTYAAPSGLVLLPPLTITEVELDRAITPIEAALAALRFEADEVHHVAPRVPR